MEQERSKALWKCDRCDREARGVSDISVWFAGYLLEGQAFTCKRCKDCNETVKVMCRCCDEEAKTVEEAEVKFGDGFRKAWNVEEKKSGKQKFKLVCCSCHAKQEEDERRRKMKQEEEEKMEKLKGHAGGGGGGRVVPYDKVDYHNLLPDAKVDEIMLKYMVVSSPNRTASSSLEEGQEERQQQQALIVPLPSFPFSRILDSLPDSVGGGGGAELSKSEAGGGVGSADYFPPVPPLFDGQAVARANSSSSGDPSPLEKKSDASPAPPPPVAPSTKKSKNDDDDVTFQFKRVAEELLRVAHDHPYERNLFVLRDYVDEDGREHFALHFLLPDGAMDYYSVSSTDLRNEKFYKAIYKAIYAAIDRFVDQKLEGNKAKRSVLRKKMEDEIAKRDWMTPALLKMGRAYVVEEERNRQPHEEEEEAERHKEEEDPSNSGRRRRKGTGEVESPPAASRAKRNKADVAPVKVSPSSKGLTPPKKVKLDEAEEAGKRNGEEEDAGRADEEEEERKDDRRRKSGGGSASKGDDDVSALLLEYIMSDAGVSFKELVEERPELLANALRARTFKQVGLLYFNEDNGTGVGLASQYHQKDSKKDDHSSNGFKKGKSPLALAIFKKKFGLHLITDNITSGDLFEEIKWRVDEGKLEPYFG